MRQVLKYNKNIGDNNHPVSSLLERRTLMLFPDTKISAVLLKIGYKGFNLKQLCHLPVMSIALVSNLCLPFFGFRHENDCSLD